MSRRGHTLLLIMLVLAMSAAAGSVYFTRISIDQAAAEREQVRVQALWLARSALEVGVSGRREVLTPVGTAVVRPGIQGGAPTVEVELSGGRATVGGEPHEERWVVEVGL